VLLLLRLRSFTPLRRAYVGSNPRKDPQGEQQARFQLTVLGKETEMFQNLQQISVFAPYMLSHIQEVSYIFELMEYSVFTYLQNGSIPLTSVQILCVVNLKFIEY
jgi:hypothetical protein